MSSNVLVGDLVSVDTRQKAFYGNKAKQNKIMNIVTKIRVNSWSNSLCALMPLWICPFSSTNVEDPLQIDLFMQNKPNFRKSQMNVNSILTTDYQNFIPLAGYKNKPNSNPIKPNLKRAKMDVNSFITKDYRKKDDFIVRINKPNLQNAKNDRKCLCHKGLQKKRLFSNPKNKPNSNPISSKARADTIKRTKARYDWNKLISNAHIIFLGQIISALTFPRDLFCGCFFIQTRSLSAPILSHGLANACYLVMAPVFM